MSALSKVYVARLVGLPVIGPDAEPIGRVRDVVLTVRSPGQPPRALGLSVELATRRRIFLPMGRVTGIEPAAVTLSTGTVSMRRLSLRPNEMLAVSQILDSRVRIDDPEVTEFGAEEEVAVADLGIEQTRTRDWVVAKVAVRSARRRLRRRGPTVVVDWDRVIGLTPSSLDLPGQGVALVLQQFEDMRAPDVANALQELPAKRRNEIVAALDDERLADVLQELPPDDQPEVLNHLGVERAVDVLEAMDPDDAADLLGDLSAGEAESLLARMDPEDSEPVRRLLTFSPDTAGGIMTPAPVVVTASTTVAEALALVRDPEIIPAAASLILVVRPPTATPTGKYLGCVHLQALLREPPANLVGGILDTDLPTLDPTDSLTEITKYFATYNMLCGPVLDDGGHLLGAVTVDDLLDKLLPRDWRDTDAPASGEDAVALERRTPAAPARRAR